MVTISARIEYKHTQNIQTSQGYIFRTLQYLFTKFYNFSNINKFFMGIYPFCLELTKISLTCKLSVVDAFQSKLNSAKRLLLIYNIY
jgi:hypothetical protein